MKKKVRRKVVEVLIGPSTEYEGSSSSYESGKPSWNKTVYKGQLYARCDDGTIWSKTGADGDWTQESIPGTRA